VRRSRSHTTPHQKIKYLSLRLSFELKDRVIERLKRGKKFDKFREERRV